MNLSVETVEVGGMKHGETSDSTKETKTNLGMMMMMMMMIISELL